VYTPVEILRQATSVAAEMMMLDGQIGCIKPGAHADLLAHFREHVDEVRKQVRNEQAYLSNFLHKQGRLAYWPGAWCASWKYHCIPHFPTNYWREPFVPAGARILIFHGVMNPPDALAGRNNGNWRAARPAPWIAAHWHE